MPAPNDPTSAIYPDNSPQKKQVKIAAMASGALAFITAVAVLVILFTGCQYAQALIAFFAACWVIGPPIWFFYEYFYLYRVAGLDDTLDLFKHGQQTAIAIWAGIGLTLGGLATSDFVKPKEPTLTCTAVAGAGETRIVLTCSKDRK